MVEAVPVGKLHSGAIDKIRTLSRSGSPLGIPTDAVAIVMATICVLGLGLLVHRSLLVYNWSGDYGESGSFVVESCVEHNGVGADQFVCDGSFTVDDRSPETAVSLVTTKGAYVSDRQPYVGEQIDVFHKAGSNSSVYPEADRVSELSRLFLSLLPRLFMFGGSALWLAGWFGTQNQTRFPKIFIEGRSAVWQQRGITWILVSVVSALINFWLARGVLGSLGIW